MTATYLTRPVTIRDLVVEKYTDAENPQTIAETSRDLGIGRETVREHLIRAGVPRRAQKARGSRNERTIAEAARRYAEDGATLWEIANEVGKTATTVRAWLIEAGVERRRPGVAVDADSLQETVRLYESGKTIVEVADEQGLHPWTVRQRLVNAGVPRRARGRRATQSAESQCTVGVIGAEAADQQVRRSREAAARAITTLANVGFPEDPESRLEDETATAFAEFIGGSLDDVVLHASVVDHDSAAAAG